MKPMRIVLFIDSLVRGGAQRQLVELALNLDRSRFDPVVLIYHDIQQLRQELDEARVPVVMIEKSVKLDIVFLVKLIRFLKATKPDVIQAYLNAPNFWARVAGKLAGIRCILTSERTGNIETSLVWSTLEKLLQHASSLIIANSESARAALVGKIGVRPEKVRVIYNGVDGAKFAPPTYDQLTNWRKLLDLREDDFVVTLPGRMSPQKNHLGLIKAVDSLGACKARIKVVFVGNEVDATLKRQLLAEIDARGLNGRFVFAGVQSDMAAIYAVSTVVVLPSLWEGFPNAVLEAMAAGKPVIASDIADNRKIIEHGVNGYLHARGNEKELAACLGAAIHTDRECLCRMGQAGSAFVSSHYSVEKMIAAYQAMYSSLCEVIA